MDFSPEAVFCFICAHHTQLLGSTILGRSSSAADQNFMVTQPMTRLPMVSPRGCSLCLSFSALNTETATSASRV